MTPERLDRWLAAYVSAWKSYDPKAIGDLFTDDAEYRYHPWDKDGDVVRGRAEIVRSWLAGRDTPGTYSAQYHALVVTGDISIAEGSSLYYTDESQTTIDKVYDNLWVLRFDDHDRCRSFTEWFMLRPDSKET